jgi:hypothetical protein
VEGPYAVVRRWYAKSFKIDVAARDSVLIGVEVSRFLRLDLPEGRYVSTRVPFEGEALFAFDQMENIWAARSEEYRIHRLNQHGDTILTIEAAEAGVAVTDADRSRWYGIIASNASNPRLVRDQMERVLPTTKPVIEHIVTDEVGNLLVQRRGRSDKEARLDVFSIDGDHLGAFLLVGAGEAEPPIARHQHLYWVTLGLFDVPQVARAPAPDFLKGVVAR